MSAKRSSVVLAWDRSEPVAGWNPRTDLSNPRPPAVPASLELTLDQYFAAAALVGVLSAQKQQPDMKWAANWALDMGIAMANESRKRRKRTR